MKTIRQFAPVQETQVERLARTSYFILFPFILIQRQAAIDLSLKFIPSKLKFPSSPLLSPLLLAETPLRICPFHHLLSLCRSTFFFPTNFIVSLKLCSPLYQFVINLLIVTSTRYTLTCMT
jgi:hypothetical protein